MRKKEKKRERIKNNKNKEERENQEEKIKSVEWQACTNRLIPSLSLKAYNLLRINDLFGHKPFRPIPSKWIISTVEEVIHVKGVVPSLALVL